VAPTQIELAPVDVFAPLYPTEAKQFRVVRELRAKGLPRKDVPPTRGDLDLATFYGEKILGRFDVLDGERREALAYVDKLFPHSRYDLMVLAADDPPKTSVADLAPRTLDLILHTAHEFIRFVSRKDVIERFRLGGGRAHLCFNYSDTLDRENGQSYDKRFHLHLNYWPGFDLEGMTTMRYRDVEGLVERRRLLDPIAFLGPSIAYDFFGGEVEGLRLLPPDDARDLSLGLPAGLKLRLPDWDALRERRFARATRALHIGLQHVYSRLSEAFTGADVLPAPWTRHRLLPRRRIAENVDRLEWSSSRSRAGILILADILRNVSPAVIARLRTAADSRIRHLTLAGLDYSMSIYAQEANTLASPLSEGRPVYMVVQTRLFSDSGTAGVPAMDRIPAVRVKRGSGTFSPSEIVDRGAFHRALLRVLRLNAELRQHNG
jgi:hypothetical protein